MDYINCTRRVNDCVILSTVSFWSQNSFQHIDVLLNGYEGSGAILYSCFETELQRQFKQFEEIYNRTKCIHTSKELNCLTNQFLRLNTKFIELLQRLKFEGFNGYPVLSETVLHFIYEQEYVAELFRPFFGFKPQNNCSVPINPYFCNSFINGSTLNCIYGNVYFWSVIGSEHTNIIDTVSPLEENLPEETQQLLIDFNNKFNNITFQLSNIHCKLNRGDLAQVLTKFCRVNKEFLALLLDFKKPNSELFPDSIKDQMPPLFFGVLDHLIAEHTYILQLCCDFSTYMKC